MTSHISEVDSETFEQLKSSVLDLDWEITDESLVKFDQQIKTLRSAWPDQRILLVYLQILGAIGHYVKAAKDRAHPASIKLLTDVFHGLESAVAEPDLSESDKAGLVSEFVTRYNTLKGEISNSAPKKESVEETEVVAEESDSRINSLMKDKEDNATDSIFDSMLDEMVKADTSEEAEEKTPPPAPPSRPAVQAAFNKDDGTVIDPDRNLDEDFVEADELLDDFFDDDDDDALPASATAASPEDEEDDELDLSVLDEMDGDDEDADVLDLDNADEQDSLENDESLDEVGADGADEEVIVDELVDEEDEEFPEVESVLDDFFDDDDDDIAQPASTIAVSEEDKDDDAELDLDAPAAEEKSSAEIEVVGVDEELELVLDDDDNEAEPIVDDEDAGPPVIIAEDEDVEVEIDEVSEVIIEDEKSSEEVPGLELDDKTEVEVDEETALATENIDLAIVTDEEEALLEEELSLDSDDEDAVLDLADEDVADDEISETPLLYEEEMIASETATETISESSDLDESTEEEKLPTEDLRLLLLSVEWEVGDQLLESISGELKRLREVLSDNIQAAVPLDFLETVLAYIDREQAEAISESMACLKLITASLEEIVAATGDVSADQQSVGRAVSSFVEWHELVVADLENRVQTARELSVVQDVAQEEVVDASHEEDDEREVVADVSAADEKLESTLLKEEILGQVDEMIAKEIQILRAEFLSEGR